MTFSRSPLLRDFFLYFYALCRHNSSRLLAEWTEEMQKEGKKFREHEEMFTNDDN